MDADPQLTRRAQSLLARREFSRRELSQRLVRGLRNDAARDARNARLGDAAVASAEHESALSARTNHAEAGLDAENGGDAIDPRLAIECVLDGLEARGQLSDERFVVEFVRARMRRGKGPTLIRAELRERGVGDALIDRFLTFSDADWGDKARAARSKRFGDALPKDAAERAQQARFLASRGFPSDLIRRALAGN